ncbi:MAG TPA: leucyl aminopeptidase [Kineosporiaceae bacterium]|nr:leucyl aminopeptidase [Kineosporiaceae bacterium]
MATLTLSTKDPASIKADAVVVAVASAPGGPRLTGAEALPAGLRRTLAGSLAALGVTGEADEVVRVPSGGQLAAPVVVLTGLGGGPVTPETLRRAAGAATRALAGTGTVGYALPAAELPSLAAVAEGALLGAYDFTRYRSVSTAGTRPAVRSVVVLTALARTGEARTAARRAGILAEAVAGTRDLVNTAPVDLYPAAFAEAATRAVEGLPVTVTVLDERKLARGGYGGLLAVGMGSARPPRLVRLDYSPAGADRHLALVGKGITFDSGGLSIKTAAGMEAMKSDMSGAAAVLNTVVAAARLELPVRITGWLALAENMPSGTAQRPSDVITVRGGKTVEVLNTDAEGRLVLADALVAAGETGPDLIVDVATLTGAQTVALGTRVSAIMANDDGLRDRVHRISEQTGEQFWPMPLPAELRASLDSPIADLANIGERNGGMLVAGLFLGEFVPARGDQPGADKVPWAHLDIAGPAFNTGAAHGYTPTGGTGVAVRTLLGLAEDVARA